MGGMGRSGRSTRSTSRIDSFRSAASETSAPPPFNVAQQVLAVVLHWVSCAKNKVQMS